MFNQSNSISNRSEIHMTTSALPAVPRLLIVTGAVFTFLAVGIAVAQYEPPSTNANASGDRGGCDAGQVV